MPFYLFGVRCDATREDVAATVISAFEVRDERGRRVGATGDRQSAEAIAARFAKSCPAHRFHVHEA